LDEYARASLGPGTELAIESESPFGHFRKYAIDNGHGTGRAEIYHFRNGLQTFIFECGWPEEQNWTVRDDGSLRIAFLVDTDIEIEFEPDDTVYLDKPSWRIMNSPPGREYAVSVAGGRKECWFSICCSPQIIQSIAGLEQDKLEEILDRGYLPQSPDHREFHLLTARINTVARDLVSTNLAGNVRIAYVEARTIELLCMVLGQLTMQRTDDQSVQLHPDELEKVRQVHEFLATNFAAPPTITELGKNHRLNKNKLIAGFKQQYGKTIAEFVQEQRLEEAKRLLLQTDLSIVDVASQVGFKHQSNFATSMKKYFGMTPKQFRG